MIRRKFSCFEGKSGSPSAYRTNYGLFRNCFATCEIEIDILLLSNYNVYELMFLFILGGEADAYRVSDAGHGFL